MNTNEIIKNGTKIVAFNYRAGREMAAVVTGYRVGLSHDTVFFTFEDGTEEQSNPSYITIA